MSLIVFIGSSNTGKTFATREWLLPALLADPGQVTSMAPKDGYAMALIHDPPTTERPDGQYPIVHYRDVAEWRRAEKRPRVAGFVNPSLDALCQAAVENGRTVLVLDEGNRLLGNDRKPSKAAAEILESGRHFGSMIVAGARRLKALHTTARSNLEAAYFGSLADDGDREDAAAAAGVDAERLRGLPEHVFLEWRRESGQRSLIKIVDRRKMTLAEL